MEVNVSQHVRLCLRISFFPKYAAKHKGFLPSSPNMLPSIRGSYLVLRIAFLGPLPSDPLYPLYPLSLIPYPSPLTHSPLSLVPYPLSLTQHPLSFVPDSVSLIPYTLPLIHYPLCLDPESLCPYPLSLMPLSIILICMHSYAGLAI